MEGIGFVPASELKAGDIIRTADGRNLPITKVEREQLEEPVLVYNFEVEDFHTYYVSGLGVLVHNTCPETGMHPPKTLYCGDSSIDIQDVFKNGFKPKGTHNDPILHTVSNSTPGNFISTSTSQEVAYNYATYYEMLDEGYMFEITTNNYIDMNAVFGNKVPHPHDYEFLIPGGVKATEIEGAYHYIKKQDYFEMIEFIPNPNFGG